MPRNTERPLNADEQRFIRHYVRERDIEKAERKSRLKNGQGIQFYKRKEVRADIERRLREIEHEQAVLDAKDIDRRERSVSEVLDPELIKVIELDGEKHGQTKLKALHLGYIVAGRIRQGNTEALDRSQDPRTTSVSVYTSVFDRRHAEDAAHPAAAPAIPAAVVQVKQPATQTEPPKQPPTPPRTAMKTVIRAY